MATTEDEMRRLLVEMHTQRATSRQRMEQLNFLMQQVMRDGAR